ncbi:unnamed protein product [Pseudo-nitzschia multistriata]|uniref:Amine oxidase domain-containing protein n=1 Tax=Pseudo-nitzschia multistriata TaxID=183589 RepID=A0A448ZB95_9STRA|nr:unnamed protein product [Pseudo-nitzschia multistriata]
MASSAAASTISSSVRVAIIGGGVSGSASARRLAQLAPSARITLYEMGRGLGGRASTRKTRSVPHIYINHGAPYADVRSKLGRSLISSLGPSGTAPFSGVRGFLDSKTGTFAPGDGEKEGVDYVTGAKGEMSQIASAMISGIPSIDTKFKTMIRGLSRSPSGEWQLLDKSEEVIGSADWLIVAGSGVAHLRWSKTFGGEPPLIAAEKARPDPKLREALDAIASHEASPVLAVFFSCSGPTARKWLSLDFDVADVNGSSILSRIMIQGKQKDKNSSQSDGGGDEWCSVVLHSTEEFALQNSGVYGSSSSATRIGDAASDASRENSLISDMMVAMNEIPGMPEINTKLQDESYSSRYDYGPVIHRWGNAFPKGDALAEDLAFLPSSRIAFCGDYVDTSNPARFGSFESALLSGTWAGEQVSQFCQKD